MNVNKSFALINRDLRFLAPAVQDRAQRALKRCSELHLAVEIFEGFRSPDRQTQLFAQGRTAPGDIVTKNKAWESFHQYGLAFDLAFRDSKGNWTWEGDWDDAISVFKSEGFESLAPFEKAHLQLRGGLTALEARAITMQHGLQSLWALVL